MSRVCFKPRQTMTVAVQCLFSILRWNDVSVSSLAKQWRPLSIVCFRSWGEMTCLFLASWKEMVVVHMSVFNLEVKWRVCFQLREKWWSMSVVCFKLDDKWRITVHVWFKLHEKWRSLSMSVLSFMKSESHCPCLFQASWKLTVIVHVCFKLYEKWRPMSMSVSSLLRNDGQCQCLFQAWWEMADHCPCLF